MLKEILRVQIMGIIEVSCSTTNGMSGSPIVSKKKVIGIYIGGSPVPGQRECVKIIQRLSKKEPWCEILEDLRNLIAFDKFFISPLFYELFNNPLVKKFALLGKALSGSYLTHEEKKEIAKIYTIQDEFDSTVYELSSVLYKKIYTAVIMFRDKYKFQANVGLSVQHEAFRQSIPVIISKFSNVYRAQTLEDLIYYLNH